MPLVLLAVGRTATVQLSAVPMGIAGTLRVTLVRPPIRQAPKSGIAGRAREAGAAVVRATATAVIVTGAAVIATGIGGAGMVEATNADPLPPARKTI
jgi:hypothetical protein